MKSNTSYSINLNTCFAPLELIDLQKLIDECREPWFNQTLCRVNDCVVRLGILKGEFHWHKHDEEDEFFFVVSGELLVDLEERSVKLTPKQGLTVPKTVVHRTRSPEGCVILMIEGAGVIPTGN